MEVPQRKNEIQDRTFAFSIRIYKLCKFLYNDRATSAIARQLLRSGTSIGANVEEAIAGQSKKDFISKMSISLKEARETFYWLRILKEVEALPAEKMNDIIDESEQVLKILTKIVKSSRDSMNT